ncbi:C-X-C chemokine receptor type 3 [Rhinatrema bivittatum]|uniref:C-X-C chemokine receptor type 3 n=1 Tax=Rhinatrema bivittatum TaxID=194408 RepID=UPI001128F96D|nr:C-X-C chemokine receptor type 3 [Rhinatrema bivittatum]
MSDFDLHSKMIFNSEDFEPLMENSSYYDYSNDTDNCCLPPCTMYTIQTFEKVFLPIFYTLVFLLGLSGNLLVIAVMLTYKHTLAGTDTFILHLAIADILLVLTLPFWAVQAVSGWIFGDVLCKIIGSVFKINFYSSIFLLVCISFDRYLSIVHAVQMYKKHKIYLVHVSCLAVWSFCFLLSIPDLVLLQVMSEDRYNTTECLHNFSSTTAHYWKAVWRFLFHVVGFLLPLCAMGYCYVMIIRTLLRSQGFQKHKAIKVIVAVVVTFILCWAPYNVVLLTDTLVSLKVLNRTCDLDTQIDIGKSITSSLGYFHCCLNPFLYAFIGIKFRNNFLVLLSQIGCIGREFMKKYLKPQRRNSTWSESGETSYSGI